MNKLLQTTLITAILATSGFASEISSISAETRFNVQGNTTANTPISVAGTLNIEGGTLTNNDVITYENTGSLLISSVFQPGSLVGTVGEITGETHNATLSNMSGADFNNGYWEFVDSSGNKYSDESWMTSGNNISIQGGKFQNRVPLTAETYNQAITNLKNFGNSGANITINWIDTSHATVHTGTLMQNSTANSDINTSSYAECFPTRGVLDFTKASSSGSFTGGPIQGGTVKLSHLGKTTASFMAMSASDIVGVYEYNKGETEFVETIVNEEKHIVAEKTGDDETYESRAKEAFEKRFKKVIFSNATPNFYAFGDDDTEVG